MKLLLLPVLVFSFLHAQVHTSYLWHLEQPNYWPEASVGNANRYQLVKESQDLKVSGGNHYSDNQDHPLNDLVQIFTNADRVAAYQYRCKDAVQSLLGLPEAGAQVNISGCLIENINSLAAANQWGYASGWQNNYVTARGWSTSGGKPRMDVTGFSFHHALSPLVSERTLAMEIAAHKHLYSETFGGSPNYSKGYWPAECAFSERIIKVLVEQGFEWSVIANSHLARTLNDYPINYGTSGTNYDPPNAADKVQTNGVHWWNGQTDGRGGTFAAPYCYQAHKAKYVDPNNGTEYSLTVVPMCDLLSYRNGYATMGTGEIDQFIAPYNNNSQPSLVLMAHDGDNAWGGGYDYYNNSVPGFANAAAGQGYVPTTVQQFLSDHPVPVNDFVHVEDGAWVNADNDWGHPQFLNWLWPMYNGAKVFDPNGWTEDARNCAVLVAAENRVQMAEDLQGPLDMHQVVHPNNSANAAEKAWHFLMAGFNSGYMYYGTSLDMEVKPSLAANRASTFADQVIAAHPNTDNTSPNVFIPQRFPYNPGGIGFGPVYGYQQHQNSSDFHVWTFAYDVSGMQSVTLKYRTDIDDLNPLSSNENETYAGGAGVNAWQSLQMTLRPFPTGNVTGNGSIDFFILPDHIADEYYAQVTGLHDTLVDYYVEAVDNQGNATKSPIQHVYVGASNPGGSQTGIYWVPSYPTINDSVYVHVPNPDTTALLHWGVNGWTNPNAAYWPSGSTLFNGTGPALQSRMDTANGELVITLGPFNNASQAVNVVDFVIHYDNNTWNNNGGADYHIPIAQPAGNQTARGFGFEVWPNPSRDHFEIRISLANDPMYEMEMLNAEGKVVEKRLVRPEHTSLIENTSPPGIYLVRLTGVETRQSVTRKFLKL
jgi:hypothetical protein